MLYGSMATRFVYEDSDVDLVLLGLTFTSREVLGEMMEILKKRFSGDSFVEECQSIPSAFVPVIKLVSLETRSHRK